MCTQMQELGLQTPLMHGVYQPAHRAICHLSIFVYHVRKFNDMETHTPQRNWYERYIGSWSPRHIDIILYNDRYFYSHIRCAYTGRALLIHHGAIINDMFHAVVIDKPDILIYNEKGTFCNDKRYYTLQWVRSRVILIDYYRSGIRSYYINYEIYEITSVTFDGKYLSIHHRHRQHDTLHVKRIFIRE